MPNKHTFHIPVMGVGFTIDSAIRIAHLGIDSVLSLNGQPLQERMRKLYCQKNQIPYHEISEKDEDYRAKRTTAYLNLLNELTSNKYNRFKDAPLENKDEIIRYIELLPDSESLKKEFEDLIDQGRDKNSLSEWVGQNLHLGSIDVNIMTKLDRENYEKGEKLPVEQNDGHAALRGYAKSDLKSSLVLSAGLNPRLFTYMEEFEDFFPDENGDIKKKIILKVSDFRSALVQGKFLAKKGLWVSEYRIESGLNCGGHAFATEGFLMGPILEEFKQKRDELYESVFELVSSNWKEKNLLIPENKLPFKFSAQGGVGTNEEHNFLLDYYKLDSIGWGSPFLLVPEVTNVDADTIDKLIDAKEDDFFLSNISPIGVPFNSLKGTSKEKERDERIKKGKPGSPCVEGNLALFNKEFTDKPVCLASRTYQNLKIKDLQKQNLSEEEYNKEFKKVTAKTCLCTGLINSVFIINDLKSYKGNEGVSICPGPNTFYFKKIMSLKEMVDHIYGRKKIKFPVYRPHMFIKELYAYIEYLKNSTLELGEAITQKQYNGSINFAGKLQEGIEYYYDLFMKNDVFNSSKMKTIDELVNSSKTIDQIEKSIAKIPVA